MSTWLKICLVAALWLSGTAAWADGPLWAAYFKPDGSLVEVLRLGEGTAARPDDGGRYQFARDWDGIPYPRRYPNQVTWEEQSKLHLPTQYDHKPVVPLAWSRTPNGELVVFFNEGKKDSNGLGQVDGPGFFGVVDKASIRWVIPVRVKQWGADRSTGYHPEVAVTRQYALVSKDGRLTAYNMEQGKQLWSIPGRLGYVRNVDGAWLVQGVLYVTTEKGLRRLDPGTGKEAWSTDLVGQVDQVTAGPGGTTCVFFENAPNVLFTGLGAAGAARYHEQTRGAGGQVIPYQTTWFGLTRHFTEGPKAALLHAVWEHKNGTWSWIFDYHAGSLTEAQKDELFLKNHFSAGMRRRLERQDW